MSASKVRVHEISRLLGVSNAVIIDVLAKEFNVQAKSHSSTVDQGVADRLIALLKNEKKASPEEKPLPVPSHSSVKVSDSVKTPSSAAKSPSMPVETSIAPSARSHPPVAKPPVSQSGAASSSAAAVSQQQRPQGQMAPRAATPGPVPPVRRPASMQTPTRIVPEPPPGAVPPPGMLPSRPASQPQRYSPETPRPQTGGGRSPNSSQVSLNAPRSSATPEVKRPSSTPPRQTKKASGNNDSRLSSRASAGAAPVSPPQEDKEKPVVPSVVRIDEPIIVRDLAILLGLRETEIIKHLFMKGMMVTVNQTLDVDFARSVAKEFNFEVEETAQVLHEGEYTHLSADSGKKLDESKFQNLQERSAVVSIMGHVDHGKTTLLDAIRETRHKIVDTEAGGITQSIGAYSVQKEEHRIVFLDTPGHEAFTAMRMRGAQATDIAILVVAADDGVMPQTIEAVNHAKAAKIPIIVAVNKIDKADADPDRVLVQLADYGLSAEKWGGDTLTVEVSALQKLGLDELLDSILLVAELLELKADPTVPGEGVIIEAQLDKRMGPMATALVRNGTLKVGDNVLIGSVGGRVRALIDDHGLRVNEAGPSTPVSILGLDGVPNAGDAFRVEQNDKVFKQELMAEKQRQRDERIGVTRSVAGFSGRLETEENKESQFNLLVKADTQGSLEAVMEVLQRMTSEEIKINIVHSATGDISEADVMLASTANALIIGFNTKADPQPQRLAEQSGVAIKRYDVIYHITEDIEKWVLGQLSPEIEEAHAGTAEVRQIFKVGKSNVIAGCMVTQGKVIRNAKARVLRAGQEIYSGPLTNLKRFKDDAKEVASGYECGISFERFHDLQEGDLVEVYTTKALERTSL